MIRSIVSLALLALFTISSEAALFTPLPDVPWAPRVNQQWAFITKAMTYNINGTSQTSPVGSVVAYGGAFSGSVNYNDIWVSTNSGSTWTLIGGTGVAGAYGTTVTTSTNSSNTANSFSQDDSGACKTYDPLTGTFYVLDETYAWYSVDGVNYNRTSTTEYVYRQSSACVVDQASKLYIIAGQSSGSAYENDVWVSSDSGHTFTQATATAAFTQRDSQAALAYVNALQVETVYAMGGHAKVENNRPSDVYISSDSGASWTFLTKAAWTGRDHFHSVVTSNKVIVMAGGKTDAYAGNSTTHLGVNDVWASFDGGYTWGFCGNAEWAGRQDYTMAMDSAGYLYIGGGNSYTNANNATGYTLMKDYWKSTISFSDTATVASTCGLTVPACGLGLRGWPVATSSNSSTYTAQGCSNGASSSSSSMIALVTVFAALVAALVM